MLKKKKYSEDYCCVRAEAEQWPDWRKEYYNCNFATSKNAKKLNVGENKMSKLELNGIWDNEYVCKLGILDHCHEIIALQQEFAINKIHHCGEEATEQCQIREMADLYLILSKYFWDKPRLIEQRLSKFKEIGRAHV